MSFPRCLYLFQYYLLNCMMLACINIWIRWDGDGQMNGKIWWKPTSSSNNRELWKYLYIMGVYLVLASCLFFFVSSPILAIRWQRSKRLIGLWQGLERFPCHLYHLRSPAVSSSSSSVNMVASAYIKKLWWSWGGGQTSPLPDTAHTEAEGTHCLPPGTPSLPWRLSHLHRWPAIYPDAPSRSACHMGIPQLQIFMPYGYSPTPNLHSIQPPPLVQV